MSVRIMPKPQPSAAPAQLRETFALSTCTVESRRFHHGIALASDTWGYKVTMRFTMPGEDKPQATHLPSKL